MCGLRKCLNYSDFIEKFENLDIVCFLELQCILVLLTHYLNVSLYMNIKSIKSDQRFSYDATYIFYKMCN